MARFCSLSSSSKGNCSYVSGGSSAILVDAGISCKQIELQLKKHDISLSEIDGILITHEHADHIKGLNVLLKNHKIPLYSSPEAIEYLVYRGMVPPGAELIPIEDSFVINDLRVTPFDTPHDAAHSLGFRIELSDGNAIGFATDLGSITQTVQDNLEGCSMVMLESNFDRGMLDCSRYPYFLKMRIKGQTGHLANEECAQEISHLVRTGTVRFMLGHLSEQNNIPDLAYETTKSYLTRIEMMLGQDYLLKVAPARTASEMLVF